MVSPDRIGAHAISTLIPDLDSFPGPRYRALSQAIAALLLDGRLGPGLRLPSERDLALVLGISRSTATAAYADLAENGLLVRRQGSGSYLELPHAAQVGGPGARVATHDHPGMLDLSVAAMPAPTGLVESALADAAPRIAVLAAQSGYQPYGLADLREAVAARYRARGVHTTADQILICNGAQHGIDLLLRLLVRPGDRVLTELPTYPGALEAIRGHHGRVVAVPFDPSGRWDTAALRSALGQAAPSVAYLMPDFQNPTGALASGAEREAVAAAARRSGTTVIVDESWAELAHSEHIELPAPMAAIDASVISIGSLSKPVWGGLRIGWVRADRETIHRLAMIRARTDMAGSVLGQAVAVSVLGAFEPILAERRRQLRQQRDALLSALTRHLPAWRPTLPEGGMASWVELDAPGSTALVQTLARHGVMLTPGARFASDGTLERFVRLPFALPEHDLVTAVERIAAAWANLDLDRVESTSPVLVPA